MFSVRENVEQTSIDETFVSKDVEVPATSSIEVDKTNDAVAEKANNIVVITTKLAKNIVNIVFDVDNDVVVGVVESILAAKKQAEKNGEEMIAVLDVLATKESAEEFVHDMLVSSNLAEENIMVENVGQLRNQLRNKRKRRRDRNKNRLCRTSFKFL